MEHETTIEAIEVAALEPGGLDRLMAGDTETSRAVAAHLAGCEACSATLVDVHRDALVIADVVATTPRTELKARTLALVRRSGVARGADVAAAEVAVDPATGFAAEPTAGSELELAATPPASVPPASSRRANLGWVASIAATVLLSVGLTTAVVADRSQAELAAQAETTDDLEHITTSAMAVGAEPDATSVELAGTTDAALQGSVLFSPSSTDLVVVATGMTEPPADQEYMCWMDAGSGRVRIGKMFFGGDLAYWAGPSEAIAGLDGPATFGVSLVDVGSSETDAEPVLLGQS
jgi:hypothetical protein